MTDEERRRAAAQLFEQAYRLHMDGELDRAIHDDNRSLDTAFRHADTRSRARLAQLAPE